MQGSDHSKESRRQAIRKKYQIALLMGDNLIDLAGVFDDKSFAERRRAVDHLRDQFGKVFIVLPNPMYGDWDAAVIDYQWQLSQEKQMEKRLQVLRSFKGD